MKHSFVILTLTLSMAYFFSGHDYRQPKAIIVESPTLELDQAIAALEARKMALLAAHAEMELRNARGNQ